MENRGCIAEIADVLFVTSMGTKAMNVRNIEQSSSAADNTNRPSIQELTRQWEILSL